MTTLTCGEGTPKGFISQFRMMDIWCEMFDKCSTISGINAMKPFWPARVEKVCRTVNPLVNVFGHRFA
jgi:hypothetical protein